jgi:hypothetical protein
MKHCSTPQNAVPNINGEKISLTKMWLLITTLMKLWQNGHSPMGISSNKICRKQGNKKWVIKHRIREFPASPTLANFIRFGQSCFDWPILFIGQDWIPNLIYWKRLNWPQFYYFISPVCCVA